MNTHESRDGPAASQNREPGDALFVSSAPGSPSILVYQRRSSVRRRWDTTDRKACKRCGFDVLWRTEDGRRVPLNEDATEHACP